MKFTPTVTVLEGNFKESQKSPPGAAGGGVTTAVPAATGKKSRMQTAPNIGNSEFREKSTPRVMEKRKIENFIHKNKTLVWGMHMPPKAYKTNGFLMVFGPKMQKIEISLKS